MAFRPHLDNLRACAERDSSIALLRCTALFGAALAAEMVTSEADEERTAAAVDDAAGHCWTVAKTLDAAVCVRDRVFTMLRGRIHDVPVEGATLGELQQRIRETFAAGTVPSRGLVYVAWTDVPARYYYVGKAGSASRLDLSKHGKLARATAPGHARLLSFVFPGQSRNQTLLDVEGSIIELVRHATGALPELNDDPGVVPRLKASTALDRVGRNLVDLGNWFSEP